MTYLQLINNVLGYFGNGNDADPTFEAYVPNIIEVAEGTVYASLRHPTMVKSPFLKSLSQTSSPPFLIPDDMLEPASIVDSTRWLFRTSDQFFPIDTEEGNLWTILGNEIVLNQDATDTMIFNYYAKPQSIATDETTPMFVLYPQLFVRGSLAEAARFLRQPDMSIAALQTEFERSLQEVRYDAWNAKLPKRAPLQVNKR